MCPSATLHQALGEAWAKRIGNGNGSYAEKALHHFEAALALDPTSRRALEAVAKLDRGPPPNQAGNSQSGTIFQRKISHFINYFSLRWR